MSKTEIARALRDTRTDQQIEILKAIRDLQAEMQALPEALAEQLTQRLEPLDAAMQAQRKTIDAAMRETAGALAGISKENLPKHLRQAAASLDRATAELPGPGTRMLELAIAGILGGLVVLAGTLVLNAIQQPASVPQQPVMEQRR